MSKDSPPNQKVVQIEYILLPDDNALTLTERFGTHPAVILELNKLKEEKDLKPGIKLKIPVAVPTVRGAWIRGRDTHVVTGKIYTGSPKGTTGLLHASCTEEAVQFCHAYYLDPRDKEYWMVSLRSLAKSDKSDRLAGINLLKPIGGDSGLGSAELPKHLAYVACGGKCDVYRGGKEAKRGIYCELLAGEAIRDKKTMALGKPSSGSVQAHLFVSGAGPEGFISLFFPRVDICLST